jgi:effector-binding domain-containing protein
MKVLKFLGLGVLGLVVLLAAIGLMLPRYVHVERATVLAAKPATVFVYLNGFKNFNRWSPWADIDPATQYSFDGPLIGVGAKQSWRSEHPNVGQGSQQIVSVVPQQSITMRLELPEMSPSIVTQSMEPQDEGTKLIWSLDADMGWNPVNRWFGLLFDKFIGPDYEKGLATLKPLIEALPQGDLAIDELSLVTTTASPWLVVSDAGSAAGDGAEVAAKLGAAYGRISQYMESHGLQQVSAPVAITRSFDEQSLFWEFDAGIPIDASATASGVDSGIRLVQSYAGAALKLTHVGSYASMRPSYEKLDRFRLVAGLESNGQPWEHYVTDPADTPVDALRTDIYWPVK